ncbi:hypothetical protein KC19_VG030100 [Ceratodon purpureus]|uniref:Uncharacterized protein n=1 Tax=Ceratodon purpureus TaxID=3225 RepID=A0A8T0HLI0_CERPU|nr:hypothetical protein KC19_VG030100 [Ceratodon purpureus]
MSGLCKISCYFNVAPKIKGLSAFKDLTNIFIKESLSTPLSDTYILCCAFNPRPMSSIIYQHEYSES